MPIKLQLLLQKADVLKRSIKNWKTMNLPVGLKLIIPKQKGYGQGDGGVELTLPSHYNLLVETLNT